MLDSYGKLVGKYTIVPWILSKWMFRRSKKKLLKKSCIRPTGIDVECHFQLPWRSFNTSILPKKNAGNERATFVPLNSYDVLQTCQIIHILWLVFFSKHGLLN